LGLERLNSPDLPGDNPFSGHETTTKLRKYEGFFADFAGIAQKNQVATVASNQLNTTFASRLTARWWNW
jgi:hypothetical protein